MDTASKIVTAANMKHGNITVHRDQLRAQRPVTSMDELYLSFLHLEVHDTTDTIYKIK